MSNITFGSIPSAYVTFDVIIILATVITSILYLFRNTLFGPKYSENKPSLCNNPKSNIMLSTSHKNRNFITVMNEFDKDIIVFFGSQTGTAEELAARLVKEGEKRYGLRCMIADLEDYDMTVLDQLPSEKIAFFIVATYGEGEPTDNACDFINLLKENKPAFSNGTNPEGNSAPLKHLKYVVFGLGNTTYEFYNAVARSLDSRLLKLGAQRVGERGEGDDDRSMEEDFLAWKDEMWKAVCASMRLSQTNKDDAPITFTYTIIEYEDNISSEKICYSDLTDPEHADNSAYNVKNLHLVPISLTRELFNSSDRSCIHVELDIQDINMTYETGDHLGMFPVNPDNEITRLAKALGLIKNGKLDQVISVKNVDPSTTKKFPFPTPTTYRVILRHYLDICAPPSRQFLSDLASLASNNPAKAYLKQLGEDKEFYHSEVVSPCYNIGRVLERLEEIQIDISENDRLKVPIPLLIENLGRLQPRYYSISSSGSRYPNSAHITAAVLRYMVPTSSDSVRYGVATNYLYSIHRRINSKVREETEVQDFLSYYIHGIHDQKTSEYVTGNTQPIIKIPCFFRKSNFRLPKNPQKPVIMVGPGTGIAPFRGFVQERIYQVEQGKELGPTILFFGCRRRDEDFLYVDEWEAMFEKLPNSILITAYSREQNNKIYVQHKLKENQEQIWKLLHEDEGYFYVCGDAKHMAKDVYKALTEIIGELGFMENDQANNYIRRLRTEGRYQEDVWV